MLTRFPILLRLYLAVICAVTALSFGCTWYFADIQHRTAFPYGHMLLPPGYNNEDFTCFSQRFQYFHQPAFYGSFRVPFSYPPPLAVAYHIFFAAGANAARYFFLLMLACYLFACALLIREFVLRGWNAAHAFLFVAVCAALSYPFMVAFSLDEMELLVWAVLALGIYLFVQGYAWQAAILFGLAGSMKYFPLIYIALPLAQKKVRDALIVLITFGGSLVLSAWFLGPSLHVVSKGMQTQAQQFRVYYLDQFHPFESGIDHSMFGLCKYILHARGHVAWPPSLISIYLTLVAVSGVILWFWRIRKMPILNQVTALSVASVLLPPLSHDYTLMHLYAPWVMLVMLASSVRTKGIALGLFCFALLFTPESFLIHGGVRFSGQFKCLVLFALLLISVTYRFQSAPEKGIATS